MWSQSPFLDGSDMTVYYSYLWTAAELHVSRNIHTPDSYLWRGPRALQGQYEKRPTRAEVRWAYRAASKLTQLNPIRYYETLSLRSMGCR